MRVHFRIYLVHVPGHIMKLLNKVFSLLPKQNVISKECKRNLFRTASVSLSEQEQAVDAELIEMVRGALPGKKWQCNELSKYPNLSIITSEITNKDGFDWISNISGKL